jgi:SAM-dependent methyltransferase
MPAPRDDGAWEVRVKLSLRGGTVLEWLALKAGLVPTPAAEAWGGLALAGVLISSVQLGVTARLAARPATAEEVAAELDLDPTVVRLMLECLRSGRHVVRRGDRYALSRSSRRWLDPASPLSVSRFVAANADYWHWWAHLPEMARTGVPVGQHTAPVGDPYWHRYIYGQWDLSRLSAGEIARMLRLPAHARTVLDVGGGHGWYSATLCQRHPGLSATVFDLPASVAVGQEIIAGAGWADRVSHRAGDALNDDLGGPYDAALCFNLVHHLHPDQVVELFARIRSVLTPGATFAVLDGFAPPAKGSTQTNVLGLFMCVSSGSRPYTVSELNTWLHRAGFATPARVTTVRRIPGVTLHQTSPLVR